MDSFKGVKLAVWDLDGTIIDSYGVYVSILKEATTLSGLQMPTEDTIRHNFHGSLEESFKGMLNMVDGDAVIILINDFLRIQEDYYHKPEEHVFDDARTLAARLKDLGVQQVVATNREHAGRASGSPHYLIDNTSMHDYISLVIAGEEASERKPSPNVLANVPGIADLQPHEIVVIGDQFVDAQLAQNLGSRAIIVNRNPDPVPHLEVFGDNPEFLTVVSSLDEVLHSN